MWIHGPERAWIESMTIIYLLTKYWLNFMACHRSKSIAIPIWILLQCECANDAWMWSCCIRLTPSVDDICCNVLFSISARMRTQIANHSYRANGDANNRFHWSQSTRRNIWVQRAVCLLLFSCFPFILSQFLASAMRMRISPRHFISCQQFCHVYLRISSERSTNDGDNETASVDGIQL